MTAPDPTALAREVLEREERLSAYTYSIPLAAQASWDATRSEQVKSAPALARAVIAASELHRPIRVYDDCGDPECLNDHVWIADTVACEDSAIGWACARCCYYGEHPLECADHKGDHTGVPQDQACFTRAALNVTHDHQEEA